ncbi:MAG TPA: DNA repair protein RecN [Bryobacteraceae bacterium]|nr:DNA repair protein RecN [Bryobacteraceae bacterium]
MLLELVVENYAVVERVRVKFHAGLNLLTGETGSGKSIVVDALALVLGGRASADMVRSDTERARVAAIFEAPREPGLLSLLEQAGAPVEEGELLLEREVLAGGKSRAFLGNRPVTMALLREIAPFLGDIHGQHEQQQLFSSAAQLQSLDDFAGLERQRDEVGGLFRRWKSIQGELEELNRSEQEKLRMADLWSFQRNEIDAAALKPGEDAQLEQERVVLRNVAKLQENANAAYAALYEEQASVSTQLRTALKKVEELARIDASLQRVVETLQSAAIGVEDASDSIRDYQDKLEADPKRLDDIEGRLALMERLKRKYGSSLGDVLAFLEDVRSKLEAIETAGERKAKLEQDLAAASAMYAERAAALTSARKTAAEKLAKKVETELASLALESAVFRIDLQAANWSEEGADRVEFLISANAGEEPRPLDKVASGGELSRIALALKTSLGHSAGHARGNAVQRTLVFDEIDTGIGGGVAEAVGRRLKKLSASSQVLCVTHLAQVAGFADHHYSVEKREVKGRTVAEVEELTDEARTREIGRMLSGQKVTPEALKHAEQLIRLGAARR